MYINILGVYTTAYSGHYLVETQVYATANFANFVLQVDGASTLATVEHDAGTNLQAGAVSVVLHLQAGMHCL